MTVIQTSAELLRLRTPPSEGGKELNSDQWDELMGAIDRASQMTRLIASEVKPLLTK